MTHDQIVANCAKFIGQVAKNIDTGEVLGAVLFDKNLRPYDPTADTPKGREQANELWKKLVGQYDYTCDSISNIGCDFVIFRKDSSAALASGQGKWWNSALASAVSELVEAKENNGKKKRQ